MRVGLRITQEKVSAAEWAAFVAAILSCCALIVGGLRYIIRHEVPGIIEASNLVSRMDKLENMVLELLTNERKKTHKKRTRR
jgi:hypothetical protein